MARAMLRKNGGKCAIPLFGQVASRMQGKISRMHTTKLALFYTETLVVLVEVGTEWAGGVKEVFSNVNNELADPPHTTENHQELRQTISNCHFTFKRLLQQATVMKH
eukprot:3986269-Amphidinium_carterae.1